MSMNSRLAEARVRRKARIRKKVSGSSERPRLSIFRSAMHTYAQIVDDNLGVTLCSASTLSEGIRGGDDHTGNIESARKVGRLLAERAKAMNITKVVFDRNGFLYHGRVQALADAAREAGLEF